MFWRRRTIVQVGLFLFLFIGVANAEPQWALVSVEGPAPRAHHAMAWDSCRDVVVLFGGDYDGTLSGRFGDTWEWNGSEWILRSTTGPTPRTGHAMSFDSTRCRTVLFGGAGESNALDDTWEWNGTTWTQECTNGCTHPAGRYASGMTYDPAHQVIVLFGGTLPGSTFLNDTWKWDGSTWMEVPTTAPRPSPRTAPAMGYDPASQRIVLFGGSLVPMICGAVSDETWDLDLSTNPATWTAIMTSPHPSPRIVGSQIVYDPIGVRMLLFGGTDFCSTSFSDTWAYNAGMWTQIPTPTAPAARHSHDMVYDTMRQEVVLFGGDLGPINNYDVRGDTWSFGNRAYSIPAVGTWGLAATMLLLLCAGSVVVMRRGRSLAAGPHP